MESIICQHLYWPGIREAAQKEVNNCDICKLTKWSTTKYGKLPVKLSGGIIQNKLFVYLIGPYKILRKGGKFDLLLKVVTVIDPITGRFEVTQYKDKQDNTTTNLVEITLICRHPWLMGIMYDQGSELISREFQKSLVQEGY